MNRTKIPPQAYTREMLQKAYEWMNRQPDSIKEQASSVDNLVSLYMRAQRYGQNSLGTYSKEAGGQIDDVASPSVQNFKSDLLSLANIINQNSPDPDFDFKPSVKVKAKATVSPEIQPPLPVIAPPEPKKAPNALEIDEHSLRLAKEVQKRFNLSSHCEALRLLVTLGYEHFKKIMPNPPDNP